MTVDAPICDFVRRYRESGALRLHMPGHKGRGVLGAEQLDITEIPGADSLYEAAGVIRQSEENASHLFGCPTFYSTEGSSQCIRAMLHLAALHAAAQGRRPLIAASRNVHRTFLSAAALLDLDVMWLYPEDAGSYLSCDITSSALDAALSAAPEKPAAVYITSPDYLGNTSDISETAKVCRRHGVLLLVDCAHGAYLRFLQPSRHPMDLGADMCCASAHKTLPVLTGGAYLHLSENLPAEVRAQAKNALALFGSTSPSYLILQSLDAVNVYLEQFGHELESFLPQVRALKNDLSAAGFTLTGSEELKITLRTKPYGYTGVEVAGFLLQRGIVCEFSDRDYVVLMLTPQLTEADLSRLRDGLLSLPRKSPVDEPPPRIAPGEQELSIRRAMLGPCRTVSVAESEGCVLATPSVGCPPAVPILVCGERITPAAVAAFRYYGVETVDVVC